MKNNMIMLFVFTSFLLFFNDVAKAQNYSIDNYVEENHIDTIVGEQGKLTPPQPLKNQGIILKWEFNEISDNPYIYLDKNGNWESLKAGETEILPTFFLSENSIEELQSKNIQLETTSTDIARYVLFNIKNNSSIIKITLENKLEENNINTTVGEQGKLTPIQPLKDQGIILDWEFQEITDSPYISLDKDGNWKTLQEGEFELIPVFSIANNSIQELEKNGIELDITNTDILWSVLFNITKKQKLLSFTYENRVVESNINAIVGEQGSLTPPQPLKDQGIILDWEFQEITDSPYISLDKNGNWKALQEGKFEFLPIFGISDSSVQKLKQEGIELEAVVNEVAIYVNFNIQNTPTKTSTTDNNTDNTLPQTNEVNNKGILLFGLLLMYGLMIYKFNKKINY